MALDLIVRGGDVVDGTGLPRYRADVGVKAGRIVAIGRVTEGAAREIDAEGHVVTPGFIDGHTHMDAQMLWDPLGTNSCWHGITTVVMGNCGFTLAPCREDTRELVLQNIERSEDLPREALEAGIDWRWTTFPSYLDVLDQVPKGINYAVYVGHSALRTWAMGERAFGQHASESDMAAMTQHLEESLRAGAIGFSSSRLSVHLTRDDRPVASRVADWSELEKLVGVLAKFGVGVFEIANEETSTSTEPGVKQAWVERMRALSVATRVPTTFGVFGVGHDRSSWMDLLQFIDDACAAGGRVFGQSHSRLISYLLSFNTQLPFDTLPVWEAVRRHPLDEQRALFLDPELREKLVRAANEAPPAARPDYDLLRVLESPYPDNPTVNEVARRRGTDPVTTMIDVSLERDFELFFMQPSLNNRDLDAVLEILRHPRNVMTFSDSGAHVGYIIDASIQTNLLAYWVRQRQEFTLEDAVRMITLSPARAWGFSDRGLVREGMVADLNVFDPGTIAPSLPTIAYDLPAGTRRLVQRCEGVRATIVAGTPFIVDGEHTGELRGQLLRGPLAAAR